MFDIKIFESGENNVWKYVFSNKSVVAEAVLYKYNTFEERTVICCSVQSGCPVGCLFCGTGKNFIKNLTVDEILFQIKYLLEDKKIDSAKISKFQIMFMSMGEPMLNWDNVRLAIIELNKLYPNAQLLVSTVGINKNIVIEDIIEISKKIKMVGLQFSIHESVEEKRNKLIPFHNKLTMIELSNIGKKWNEQVGRNPFINYCVHENNNSVQDMINLSNIFDPKIFKLTLSVICEKDSSISNDIDSKVDLIDDFKKLAIKYGYDVRVFNPAGQDDIGGGCGQLWFVQDWLKNFKSNVVNTNV